jgi:hypothetical protein
MASVHTRMASVHTRMRRPLGLYDHPKPHPDLLSCKQLASTQPGGLSPPRCQIERPMLACPRKAVIRRGSRWPRLPSRPNTLRPSLQRSLPSGMSGRTSN